MQPQTTSCPTFNSLIECQVRYHISCPHLSHSHTRIANATCKSRTQSIILIKWKLEPVERAWHFTPSSTSLHPTQLLFTFPYHLCATCSVLFTTAAEQPITKQEAVPEEGGGGRGSGSQECDGGEESGPGQGTPPRSARPHATGNLMFLTLFNVLNTICGGGYRRV